MKFMIVLAILAAVASANPYGYHYIPPRVDIAPGGAEIAYSKKVIPEVYQTHHSTPIYAPVYKTLSYKIPIKQTSYVPVVVKSHSYAPAPSYGHGDSYGPAPYWFN